MIILFWALLTFIFEMTGSPFSSTVVFGTDAPNADTFPGPTGLTGAPSFPATVAATRASRANSRDWVSQSSGCGSAI